jgi:tetratricopeptide (TPR) repeat protein
LKAALTVLICSLLSGQSLESYLADARTAEVAGDLGAAERAYEKAVELHPDAATFQRLGLVRHLQNKFALAIPAFEQSLRLDPNQWSARLFLGIDLYRMNRYDLAFTQLERAARLRPNDPDTRFWLGLAYLARKDYLPGLVLLEQVSSEQPKNLEILRILAENYAVFGTSLLNRVAENNPDTPAGLQVQAQALEFEGANDAALEAYSELERRAPGRPGVAEAITRLRAISAGLPRPSPQAAGDESPIPH